MKIHSEMLTRWTKYCSLFCKEKQIPMDSVDLRLAWAIAHKLDIPKEAYYTDDTINDSHIETALKKIFNIKVVNS